MNNEWTKEIERLKSENEGLRASKLVFVPELSKDIQETMVRETGCILCAGHIKETEDGKYGVYEIAKVKELESELSAWQSVFGTSQLSHASEAFRVANARIKELTEALEKIRKEYSEDIRKRICDTNIAFYAKAALEKK